MRVLGIIPARYGSVRFPGKPLTDILGKPMVQHVWERASESPVLDDLVIATDDERIADAARGFGARVVRTSSIHRNGTERCSEVLSGWANPVDVVINIQGDEPGLDATCLDQLVAGFDDPHAEICTLTRPFDLDEDVHDPGAVKVVTDRMGRALYFSRSPIPHGGAAHRHVGLYAFRSAVLPRLVALDPTPLETAESLEQLRWLENGHVIRVLETSHRSISIDRPQDVDRFIQSQTHGHRT